MQLMSIKMSGNERIGLLDEDEVLNDYFYFERCNNDDLTSSSDEDELDEDDEEARDREIDLLRRIVHDEDRAQHAQLEHEQQLELEQINPDLSSNPENGSQGVDPAPDFKALSQCSCPVFCLSWMEDKSNIDENRALNASLDKAGFDLLILGKLSTSINRSHNIKKDATQIRKQARNNYMIEGHTVCLNTFRYYNNIGRGKLNVLSAHYRQHGTVPRSLKYKGRNKKAVNLVEARRIVDFLKNIATIHALDLPGRVPGAHVPIGFKKTEVKVLPSDMTIQCIYDDYVSSCQLSNTTPRSLRTFRRIWKDVLPMVIISKPSTDLCWTCQQHNYNYKSAVNNNETEKAQLIQQQQMHLMAATEARKYMNNCISKCKEHITGASCSLQNRNISPLSGPDYGHYCFDFAQQEFKLLKRVELHYPSDPQQPGPIYFKTPRKCALFGVCCPAFPTQVNYLVDEAVATNKGANAVVSYLHHFLENYSLKEKNLVLHADNCAGQNKNNTMMGYLVWRVATGRNLTIEMNFLIAGHTKFPCDLHFGYLKKKTRRTKLSCLQDIENAVNQSAKGNVSQLVGLQDGTVQVPVYDWSAFLPLRKLQGIKKAHHFRMTSAKPGHVLYRQYFDSRDQSDHQLLRLVPEGVPQIVSPEGLSLQRRQYLAKEIREFCPPETRDLVCPIPNDDRQEEEESDDNENGVKRHRAQ